MFEISRDHIIVNDIRVEWVELGEGWNGDYDPDDPDDEELLRFDVYWYDPENAEAWDDGWVAVPDTSYCTRFPALASPAERITGLCLLMSKVYEPAHDGYSIKKLCEQLSWIGLDWLDKYFGLKEVQSV